MTKIIEGDEWSLCYSNLVDKLQQSIAEKGATVERPTVELVIDALVANRELLAACTALTEEWGG